MREVRRVLRKDGVVFLNLGDTYHGSGRGLGDKMHPTCCPSTTRMRKQGKAKSLSLIPHRVMIALEADGWIIRNDVIWQKPNPAPESIKDRCTCCYEHVIIMTKNKDYCWNAEEAIEPSVSWEKGSLGGGTTPSKKDGKMREYTMRHSNKVGSSKTEKRLMPPIGNVKHQALGNPTLVGNRVPLKLTRNLRDVWSINTYPHKDKHVAMFPEALVERCVRLGSRPGDTILDCFAGAGTTGVVARQLGRNAVLMDISQEYCGLMRQRLAQVEVNPPPPSPSPPEPTNQSSLEETTANKALVEHIVIRRKTTVVNQEFVQWAKSYTGRKFHACISDFPYGYFFMSSSWDDPRQPTANQVHKYLPSGQRMTTMQENLSFQQSVQTWGEAILSHLLPGALVFVFAGTRMFEWVSTGMAMAGFQHLDTMMWLYGQGWPKAQDIGKMLDKTNGNERTIHGRNSNSRENCTPDNSIFESGTSDKTDYISSGPSGWDGYKTPALKPGWEPILCFRAPRGNLTYAELATKYGTGCLNIDGARIDGKGAKMWDRPKGGIWHESVPGDQRLIDSPLGRYPANVVLDEEVAKMLGDVSRFYYCPKASRKEREAGCEDLPVINSGMSNGAQIHGEGYDKGQDIGLNRVIPRRNDHPCVKPIALTRHLATLLLPPASVSPRRLLVPFSGAGSELIGGLLAGWDVIVGIEQDEHYCRIAEARIDSFRMGQR
jgi:DNA modification methylase